MKKWYYFYELIAKLGLDNVATCISHTFPDGDKVEYVEGKGVIWTKTGNLVELDWTVLPSKWELEKKALGKG